MEPSGQSLCIVTDRSRLDTTGPVLPFDGDPLLSVILSEAFLLAVDTICDPTIVEQLRR